MKKLIIITVATLFTGIVSSCQKANVRTELIGTHSFTNGFKRDLGSAD
ncbi:hypothetical protein G7092_08580 [Mucilaginibacter sp. HC2]|nr:hypothetical protein [Mucilaginibacter inviolabilis]NHA03848.1 hypothetical protein [Mucilaginibacter inviolabilis]